MMGSPSVGTAFLHAIDPGDVMAVHNLCLIGSLTSAVFGPRDPAGFDIREAPIETLMRDLPRGTLSPWAVNCLFTAAIIRGGGKTGNGVPPYRTQWHDEAQRAKALALSDTELALERVRREVAPQAPSRLTCLFLAEDTDEGRQGLVAMYPRRRIVKVMLTHCLRAFRADPLFRDEHLVTVPPSDDLARSYWSGSAHSQHRMWEWLLDGQIALHPDEDRQALSAFAGQQIAAYRQWQDNQRLDDGGETPVSGA